MKSSLLFLNSLPKIPFPVFSPNFILLELWGCWFFLSFTLILERAQHSDLRVIHRGNRPQVLFAGIYTFQLMFYWQSLQSSISADTFFSQLCQFLEQSLQLACIVWEWGGSVCEAMHGWSHALATPLGMSNLLVSLDEKSWLRDFVFQSDSNLVLSKQSTTCFSKQLSYRNPSQHILSRCDLTCQATNVLKICKKTKDFEPSNSGP